MKNLRKGIALALLTSSIFSTSICFNVGTAYAAPSSIQKAADKEIYDPHAFTERIKKYLLSMTIKSAQKQQVMERRLKSLLGQRR